MTLRPFTNKLASSSLWPQDQTATSTDTCWWCQFVRERLTCVTENFKEERRRNLPDIMTRRQKLFGKLIRYYDNDFCLGIMKFCTDICMCSLYYYVSLKIIWSIKKEVLFYFITRSGICATFLVIPLKTMHRLFFSHKPCNYYSIFLPQFFYG